MSSPCSGMVSSFFSHSKQRMTKFHSFWLKPFKPLEKQNFVHFSTCSIYFWTGWNLALIGSIHRIDQCRVSILFLLELNWNIPICCQNFCTNYVKSSISQDIRYQHGLGVCIIDTTTKEGKRKMCRN